MNKACVLVVDDHQDMIDLMQLVLEGEGFYVAVATDGEQAIELLTQFRPAIIITDLMMPKTTGVELIRHVKSKPELADIPIVAMSAARSGEMSEAKAAGAVEALTKPLDFDRLVELLKHYVPSHTPTSEHRQGE
ncbi:MAG: response regulator [Blastocatellia bacterium]